MEWCNKERKDGKPRNVVSIVAAGKAAETKLGDNPDKAGKTNRNYVLGNYGQWVSTRPYKANYFAPCTPLCARGISVCTIRSFVSNF